MKQNVDIVIHDSETGDFYTGQGIRRLLGVPERGGTLGAPSERKDIVNFSPIEVMGRDRFPIFISSTSVVRKVSAGDRVLYRKTTLN